jgi:hypothetical protein
MNLNKGYSLLALILGMAVLFVSVSRASIDLLAQEGNELKVRIEPIEFTIYHSDGSTEPVTYKVPEVNTISSNPFYGFKKLRDYLWLMFSKGNVNKAKVALLIADKKISESVQLINSNESKLALEAGVEALDKLKYADSQIAAAPEAETEKSQINNMIYQAGFAYRQVMSTMEGEFEIDREKLKNIIDDLDEFNEQKRKEKENMEW